MVRSEKKLTELSTVLNRGKYNEIIDKIVLLRSEEPFEGAIKLLAQFYDKSENADLKMVISSFFNDMKDLAGRSEIIESILSVRQPASRAMLASSCWQSGLDYSEYAVALADAFIEGDYMTSLECFTVLENCIETIKDDDKSGIVTSIEKKMNTWDIPKQRLAGELITLMRL